MWIALSSWCINLQYSPLCNCTGVGMKRKRTQLPVNGRFPLQIFPLEFSSASICYGKQVHWFSPWTWGKRVKYLLQHILFTPCAQFTLFRLLCVAYMLVSKSYTHMILARKNLFSMAYQNPMQFYLFANQICNWLVKYLYINKIFIHI